MISQTINSYDENNENNLNINSINNNNNDFNNNDKNSNKNSNNNIQIISNKNSSNNLNKNSINNLSKNSSNNLKKISIKNSNKNCIKNSIKNSNNNSNNNSNIFSNQNSKKNSIRNFNSNNYNQNDRMPFNLNNNKSIKKNNINSINFNSNSNNFIDDENDNNNNKSNKKYINNIIENYNNENEYKKSNQFSENIDDDDENNSEENNNDNLNVINTSNKIISGNNNNKNNMNNNNDNENSENKSENDNISSNEEDLYSDIVKEDSKYNHNFSDNNSENDNNKNNEITNKYKIQYIIESRKGFENLIDKNYLSAKSNYLKCFEYSSTYLSKDKQKIIDSLINLSITEFYDAEFEKSLEYINQAHNVYINTNFYDDNINTNTLNELGIKLYTNFILSNLSLNNYDDCLKNANEIVKIIQNEIKKNNKEKAKNYFQDCVYTLFRVNTLKNSDSVLMDEFNLEENINNNNKKKIINHIMKGFQEFLKSKNYEFLYNHFKEANDKYKEIEDKNGYYFTFFYQYVSLFELGKLNEKEIEQIKKKISVCNKKVIGSEFENLKEKSIDVVIKEFKEKSECAVNIFNILLNVENEIENNFNNDNSNIENESETLSQSKILDKSHLFTNEKISTPIFIKLLLSYSLNYLKKLNKKKKNNNEFITTLIKEIELLFDKIKKDLINIDIINLKFLDIEITQSLKTLFDNLILIYYKSKLKKALIKYKIQINKQIKIENEIKIQNFFEHNLNKVENGFLLKKINFSSSGTKEHYYLIDPKNNNFCIGKNEKDKNKENKNLINEIIKIVYGFSSRNIKKKIIKEKDDIKNLLKKPWKFLSVVLKDRSIDLYMENNIIKENKNNLINYYFYGFFNYYQKQQKLFKINSCSYFFCLRTKFKLIWKLKEMYKNGKLKDKNEKSLKLFQDIFNEKGIQKFSFVKLFLLFFQNFDDEEEKEKEEEKIVL